MSTKTVLEAALAALAIGLIGFFLTYPYAEPVEVRDVGEIPVPVPEISQEQSESDEWHIYRNEEYGFEFEHPNSIRVGAEAQQSSLGTYKFPKGGSYVGPFVFVIIEDDETRTALRERFNEESVGRTENYTMHSVSAFRIPNEYASVIAQKSGGEGGPSFNALIRGETFDVFVDGYSMGYPGDEYREGSFSNKNLLGTAFDWSTTDNIGKIHPARNDFRDTSGIEQLLSTFRFISIFYSIECGVSYPVCDLVRHLGDESKILVQDIRSHADGAGGGDFPSIQLIGWTTNDAYLERRAGDACWREEKLYKVDVSTKQIALLDETYYPCPGEADQLLDNENYRKLRSSLFMLASSKINQELVHTARAFVSEHSVSGIEFELEYVGGNDTLAIFDVIPLNSATDVVQLVMKKEDTNWRGVHFGSGPYIAND